MQSKEVVSQLQEDAHILWVLSKMDGRFGGRMISLRVYGETGGDTGGREHPKDFQIAQDVRQRLILPLLFRSTTVDRGAQARAKQ